MRVRIDPGAGEVTVDGHHVEDSVSRVSVDWRARQVPEVYLELRPDAAVDAIDLEGVVTVFRDRPDPEALVRWLAAIDPMTLEQEALGRMGGFGSDLTTGAAFLAVLRDWAALGADTTSEPVPGG
jgi:hypothetical protein